MQFRVEYVKRAFFGGLVLSVLAGATAAHADKIDTTYTPIKNTDPPRAKLSVTVTGVNGEFDDLHIMTRSGDTPGMFKILKPLTWKVKGVTKHAEWSNKTYLDLDMKDGAKPESGYATVEIEGPAGRGRDSVIRVTLKGKQLFLRSDADTFASPAPEPASLSLLALGGLAALRRRA